jgi:hypothetical protein
LDKPGQAEEPCRGGEVLTVDDAVGHQELCTVDDEPGQVTDEKHNDNADQDASKVHLVVGTAVVAVGSDMGIPATYLLSCIYFYWSPCTKQSCGVNKKY